MLDYIKYFFQHIVWVRLREIWTVARPRIPAFLEKYFFGPHKRLIMHPAHRMFILAITIFITFGAYLAPTIAWIAICYLLLTVASAAVYNLIESQHIKEFIAHLIESGRA